LLQPKSNKDKFFALSNLGFRYLITYVRIRYNIKILKKLARPLYRIIIDGLELTKSFIAQNHFSGGVLQ
jgi:hypothetical protein